MLGHRSNRRRPGRRFAHRMFGPEILEERRTPATISVTSPLDADPSAPASRDDQLTLREAILIANGALPLGTLTAGEQALVSGPLNTGPATPDRIEFDVPGAGVQVVTLGAALPTITDAVVIDGYTQGDAAPNTNRTISEAVIRVQINAPVSGTALTLAGGGSTIRGIALGGSDYAINIVSDGNVIQGSFIGVAADGTTPNRNALGGIVVSSGAGNLVGGVAPGARNVIATGFSNGVDGMITVGNRFDQLPAPTGTRIQGNLIGTNAAGNAAVGAEGEKGITITEGFDTLIGGDDAADGQVDDVASAGNVISGTNTGINVVDIVDEASFSGLTIQGNRIGLTADGSAALPNGIGVNAASSVMLRDVLIGGTSFEAGNTISGNAGEGLVLGRGLITVQGNYIGPDPDGNSAVPNTGNGIYVAVGGTGEPLLDILIGGAEPAARNIISGNGFNGIRLSGISSGQVRIQGNYIGTDRSGQSPLGNAGNGINVDNRPAFIGGTNFGEGNVIAFNGAAGVAIRTPDFGQPLNSPILGNSIFANAGLGIDLGGSNFGVGSSSGDGVTDNDPGDADVGPNGLQNYPAITFVARLGATTRVDGELQSTPGLSYLIQVFGNDARDPSGLGEGQALVDSFLVETDGAGAATFSRILDDTGFTFYSATATEVAGEAFFLGTSEFGPSLLPDPSVIDVSVAASADPGTIAPGGFVTFTFTVTIPNSEDGVVAPQFLVSAPAGATFVSFTAPQGWTATTPEVGGVGDVRATTSFAPDRGTLTFTMVVQVDPAAADGFVVSARGLFASETVDPNSPNDAASASAVVAAAPTPTPAPTAAIGAATTSLAEGDSGTRLVSIPVTLSAAPTSIVTLNFQVVAGTAVAGSDYLTPVVAALTFTPGGPLTQLIQVAIAGDATVEPDEAFQVVLLAGDGYTLGAQTASTVTILNDDVAAPGGGGGTTPPPDGGGTTTPPSDGGGVTGPTDAVGPALASLVRYGFHAQPTILVLTFSEPLAAAAGTNAGAYRIVDPGRDGRFGTRDDRAFTASSATLDGSATAVTLRLPRQLNLHLVYRLDLDGSIADLAGNTLAGAASVRIDHTALGGAYRNGVPQRQPRTIPAPIHSAARTVVPRGPLLLRRNSVALRLR
ncbi:beta strand repeat-containing protein [Paludisphaera mucosa]|uniref:Calx-beta domain-containing protein n=1 Tax=Paludisphaera mucosa TaxID=3030827 RepID=A0ABT6FKE3_9BACT|nr:Calx-beta domain-containing protein [Paludisphaera mucosa]MDG3008047.1 Calx-beta domain-containing protein [Paludisphaera mucosa]